MSEVTRILTAIERGDAKASEELPPLVYNELRRLAAHQMAGERPGHTLQPTALVHEAFLCLRDSGSIAISDRVHFFRLASKMMRQILVDHARKRQRLRRGGDLGHLTLTDAPDEEHPVDLLELDDALRKLEQLDARKARLVELRFFAGLGEEEAAETIGISRTQAAREWRTTRAWLADELSEKGRA